MRTAVYNSAIPEGIVNTAHRTIATGPRVARICVAIIGLVVTVQAADWNGPEQNLARKIVAITGPGAVVLKIENRSSLGRRDAEIIENGLRSVMEGLGLRFVTPEQAAAAITISLSENRASYVWVADIREGASESSIVMTSTFRPEGVPAARDSLPLTLRPVPLWTQEDRILDVAVLDENQGPTHMAVLDPGKVALYRLQGGKWQIEQQLPIAHQRPWPRDLRGRLIPGRDHLLDAYLPGVSCTAIAASPLSLTCRETDDPWPLAAGTWSGGTLAVFPSAGLASGPSTVIPQLKAFYASTRNFFTGTLAPGIGKLTAVPKFYSAALLPRDKYTLWLFAGTDGQTHLVDGMNDQAARLGWGSDLASVKTSCGSGWQVLSSSTGDAEDSIRAYEFPDRDPVTVSAAIDFPGPITALWTESKGDSAVTVARNLESGNYEAFRILVACSQ